MIKTIKFGYFIAVAALIGVSVSADALEIGGTLIGQYADREGDAMPRGILQATQQHTHFGLTQATVNFSHDFTKLYRTGFSVSSNGNTFNITEAWFNAGGLPCNGDMTVGRFYKPLGAPLLTAGLSYPALLFHSSPVTGIKVNMDYYPFRWEAGFVNQSALSAQGSFLSGSPAFGRPVQNVLTTHLKEGYAFLGWRDGGTWGSLDLNAGVTFGTLPQVDQNTILGLNLIQRSAPRFESSREIFDFAADYTYGPCRIYGEYAIANEGIIQLVAWNLNGSYRIGKYLLTVGYDELGNNFTNRTLATPASLERERISYGITWEYHPQLNFSALIEDNKEYTTGATFDVADNNAVIVQMMASF